MSKLRERIKEGLAGKYKGLSNGFSRINSYIFGVQRGIITLIGGQSGCFKTTLLDFIVINALEDAIKNKITLNLFYNSFEIDELTKMCNWLSVMIYKKHKIIISPEKIKGLGDNRLNAFEQSLVDEVTPEVELLFSKIHWNFKPENPTGLYSTCWKFMENRGTFIYQNYTDIDGKEKKKIIGYLPNNPDEYNLMVTDHFYLLKKERDYDVKRNIDKFSEYQVELARLFKFSFINLQQFNQGLNAIDRQKLKGVDISPAQGDFRDTTNPYSDSDICIGLMPPYKLELDTCLGYDIKRLKESFVMFKIIKNRLSKDNVAIGLFVNPKAGSFEELPPAKELLSKDYEKYINK